MNIDDRDIVCETDYSPLSNEELAAQIEWHAAAMSGVSAYVLERITGPARALMARVEAAKAERNTAARRAFNAEADNQRLTAENRRLVARVAELESQLAAQGWRAVTETMTMTEQRLTSDELRQVLAEWIRPMYTRERRKLAGLFEAVIARVEAAEAEAEDAILAASDAAQREENAMHALSHFRARVAELESQLAAQGWRPVTEDWPPYDERARSIMRYAGGSGGGYLRSLDRCSH
jgi:uncharacterized coiled-coil protein SlyX